MPAYHEILTPYRECTDVLFIDFKQQNLKEDYSKQFEIGPYRWQLIVTQQENSDVSVYMEMIGRVSNPRLQENHLNAQDVRYVDLGVCAVAPLKTPKMMTLFGNDLKSNVKKWGWKIFFNNKSLFGDSKNEEGWLGPHKSLRFRVWVNYRPEEKAKNFTELDDDENTHTSQNSQRSVTTVTSSEAESRVYLAHTARIVWDLLFNVKIQKNPSYKLNCNKVFKGSSVETMFQLLCHMHNEEYEIKALWDVYGLAEVSAKFHCRLKIHSKIQTYIEQHKDDLLLNAEDIGDPCHIVQILELAAKYHWKSILSLCEWKIYTGEGSKLFQHWYVFDLLPKKSKDRILYILYHQVGQGKNPMDLTKEEFYGLHQDKL